MQKIILFFLSSLLLIGCGDLFMKDDSSNSEDYSQFVKCDLDVEAFSYILEKNIKGDILCLKENMNLFVEFVKTDRPGYVSKSVLKEFIEKGPFDVEDLDDVLGMVDAIFDLSYLIRGTERSYIKKADVDVLLDFLVFFNQHIWKSYKYFMSEDDVNYSRHLSERQIIYNEFALIAKRLKEIYKADREHLDRIDTERFLFNFFRGETKTLEKIRALMFLKRVFLGGSIWDLTHVEFNNALNVAPDLAQVAFDFVKLENYEFQNEQETLVKVFQNDIDVLKKFIFYDDQSFESLFTVYDIIHAVVTVAPDMLPVDISDYPKELIKLKDILLGSSSEIFSAKELAETFDHMNEILGEASLIYRIYDFARAELDGPDPITHGFENFPARNSKEDEYRKNFARMVQDYKFVKGSEKAQYYTFDYNRNANAFFQISAIEYLVKIAMKHYGRENKDARGGYDITLDQTVEAVWDFKWFLKDQGIINIGRKGGGEVEGVADNFVLLSTLFQYQSDGCDDDVCMEVPEITEFAIGLLTALEVKDFITETMTDFCANELDEFDRIAPDCFRRNFIDVFETPIPGDGRSLADYMPLFHDYLRDLVKNVPQGAPITESKDFMKFITETEGFTRSCIYWDEEETEESYMKANDAFAVFAGLLNVESTMLRFDLDQNNNVDATNADGKNEVMKAYYSTYKGAVVALVEDQVGQEWIAKKLAKPMFQYLVKYGTVPNTSSFRSIWGFVKFILKKSKNKKADITRTTVASILKTIGEQSENSAQHPYKCAECFQDPSAEECVPEGRPWD